MKRKLSILAGAALLVLAVSVWFMPAHSGDKPLKRAKSTSINTSAYGNAFKDVAGHVVDDLHSLMVLKDGEIIYEEYAVGHDADELHTMWSASKTFTATAIGFAVQDGLVSLTDHVVDYFDSTVLPKHPSKWLKEMTVYDLLIMSSGFSNGNFTPDMRAGRMSDPTRQTLNSEVTFKPGTKWSYNSMNSYLLSAIITKVTGQKMADYLDAKLFKPLGIRNYYWEESDEGINSGGWGLYLTTESLAKMGQFFLQRGEWDGKQLLDPEWIEDAMSPHIYQWQGRNNLSEEQIAEATKYDDWNLGYGYQMWCCQHGAARLDGAWGQFCTILPDKNAVVVMTALAEDTKTEYRTLWKYIYDTL